MSRLLRLLGLLLLGMALAVPTPAGEKGQNQDDKKDEKKDAKKKIDDDRTKPKAKEKFGYGYTFSGKIKSLDPNSVRDFTVERVDKTTVPDKGGHQRLFDLKKQLAEQQFNLAREKNPQNRPNILKQIAQTNAEIAKVQLWKVEEKRSDVQLRAADDIKVSWYHPPIGYDEKGNVRKYTAEDLKRMKSEHLPGYKAEDGWEAVRNGQTVQVYVAKPPAPAKGTKGKKDDLDDVAAQARQEVVGITILAEPQQK